MKREVLRIGGYRQEFFEPELAAMAYVIIDLKRFKNARLEAANPLT